MITPDRIEVKDEAVLRIPDDRLSNAIMAQSPYPILLVITWTLLLSLLRFCERRSAPVIVPYNHLGFKHYAFIE